MIRCGPEAVDGRNLVGIETPVISIGCSVAVGMADHLPLPLTCSCRICSAMPLSCRRQDRGSKGTSDDRRPYQQPDDLGELPASTPTAPRPGSRTLLAWRRTTSPSIARARIGKVLACPICRRRCRGRPVPSCGVPYRSWPSRASGDSLTWNRTAFGEQHTRGGAVGVVRLPASLSSTTTRWC